MLQRLKVPNTLQWVIRLFLLYMLIFTVLRIVAYCLFNPDLTAMHGETPSQYTVAKVIPAFLLGMLYDARWVSIVLAPLVIVSCIPNFTPFKHRRNKIFWSIYLTIITFLILFFFGADFGHFQYVRTRLNASALNFFEDASISLQMLWESYPILWILLLLGMVITLLIFFINKTYFAIEEKNMHKSKYDYQRRWYLITLAAMALAIYGNVAIKPLSTADSFRKMDDEFRGFLALNPFQNFFTSLKFRNPAFEGNKINEDKRWQHYNTIANLLQLDSTAIIDTTYTRIVQNKTVSNTPNVVLIMCESLSTYKTSLGNNALQATPYLQQLAQESIYFDKCFSPTFGTARGLFAWLTGIPDVQLSKFSTRNAKAINQHTILNNFEGYDKLYFIGGSPSFNNFEGLINNIEGVQLYQEKNYTEKRVNVWGISDYDLFKVSNEKMRQQTKPFVTIIQTADFHEPYTIPKHDTIFKLKNIPKDVLKQNGFTSVEEYNSLRYFDYAVAFFIEKAKQESYFNNTIFVFFGDHGVIGNAGSLYPNVYTTHRLTEEHIPLLFYAPSILPKQVRKETVSQLDILPTVASMAHQSYTNHTIGRNLLDTAKRGNYAFTIFHDAGKIGIVSDSFYYIHNYNTGDDELLSVLNNEPVPPLVAARNIPHYYALAEGIYETSKWMLIHNKRK